MAKSTESRFGKELVNGVELYYECRGEGRHVLVCLPGLLNTTKMAFINQLSYFGSCEGFKIVVFDPRGYGNSRPPRRVFSGARNFELDAEDAKGLMNALGIKQFSVLGWSSGGVAGLVLATLYPDSVKTLTVWGSKAYQAKEDLKFVQGYRDVSKWNDAKRQVFEQVYGKDELQYLVCEWCDTMEELYYSATETLSREMLANIKCSTLILHGMKDLMVPNFHPYHLLKNIQGSVLYTFDEGKHNIHQRYPEEFNQIVETFLRKHETIKSSSKL